MISLIIRHWDKIIGLMQTPSFVYTMTVLCIAHYLYVNKDYIINWFRSKANAIARLYRLYQYGKRERLSLAHISWCYRGEGNEYLAISLPEKRLILRLKKFCDSSTPASNGICMNWLSPIANNFYETALRKQESINLDYYKIVASLIGECFVQPAEDVILNKIDIERINKSISPLRPEHRKYKNVKYPCGALLTDYAYLPQEWDKALDDIATYAVEIKPKQGWIGSLDRFGQTCTYCIKQYEKLENGDISTLSQYCPMDLFSGDHSRMKKAIKNLLDTPQNNLKIFCNGRLIYGEGFENNRHSIFNDIFKDTTNISSETYEDEFCEILVQALERQFHVSECHSNGHMYHSDGCRGTDKNNYYPKICNFSRSALVDGCVLDRILRLQAIDVMGSRAVAPLWKRFQHKIDIIDMRENMIKKSIIQGKTDCSICLFTKYFSVSDPFSRVESTTQRYLMAAVAKDCSLMVTFKRIKYETNSNIPKRNVIHTEGNVYAFNVGVFDLYPKPLTCLFKHYERAKKAAKKCDYIEFS